MVLLHEPTGAVLGLTDKKAKYAPLFAPKPDHQNLVPVSNKSDMKRKWYWTSPPQEQFWNLPISRVNVHPRLHPDPITNIWFLF
jgi:hypothetical protein